MATTRSGLGRSLRLGMDAAARRNPELSAARRKSRPRGPFNPRARLVPGNSVVRAPSIKANAVPRPGDLRSAAVSLARGQIPRGSLLGDIVTAIRQPMIRTTAAAGGTHILGGNLKNQIAALSRSRARARQSGNVSRASTNFQFGQRQTGRLVARRRGTPVRGGLPTYRPR